MDAFLGVLFRWLHIVPAAIVIGGVFVMRVVLPIGLSVVEPDHQQTVFLRCRRVFKMAVHTSILFLLVSGGYNTWSNWAIYKETVPWSHAFWGPHVVLGLTAMAISLYVLAGKEPPKSHAKLMAGNLVLLLIVVFAASATKWVRDHPARYYHHSVAVPSMK